VAFEAAMTEALTSVTAKAEGVKGYSLRRGIESPNSYLLQVEWETVAHHTEIYHQSPGRARWRDLVTPYFASKPKMAHFDLVVRG
jgi:quinol monooxygenase YgiN